MTPDPSLLYLTEMHREALSGLLYAILEQKGFVVLTGEAGTGKTTLLSSLLRSVPKERAHFSMVLNPILNPSDFLESALCDFGITDIPASKVHRLQKLQQFVIAAHAEHKTCVLVVDEAHKLSVEVLEEIRLLSNFETAEHKLLQIILAGQNELRHLLNREDLRQLKQRVAVGIGLKPLSAGEVEAYIHFRWAAVGGRELPFEPEAIGLIAQASARVPRVINAVCDNAMLLIYATEERSVTSGHVRQVLADLDLHGDPRGGDSRATQTAPLQTTARAPEPVAASLRFEIPKPVAPPAVLRPMRLATLERYLPADPKPSLWARWTARFRVASLEGRPS